MGFFTWGNSKSPLNCEELCLVSLPGFPGGIFHTLVVSFQNIEEGTPKKERESSMKSYKEKLVQENTESEQRLQKQHKDMLALEIRKYRRRKLLKYHELEQNQLREVSNPFNPLWLALGLTCMEISWWLSNILRYISVNFTSKRLWCRDMKVDFQQHISKYLPKLTFISMFLLKFEGFNWHEWV